MSHPCQLTAWRQELASRFPDLSPSVVAVLALYSFGMILAHTSGLSSVVWMLSLVLGWSEFALRKRLSEFYKEAEAKSGQKRCDFDVTNCFAPLLAWVLSLWPSRVLSLAIDVTNLGERFHVLCISVVVGGNGIPVAWKVLYGGEKEAWGPHWQRLVRKLKTVVPASWTVLVLSDRGLESPDWFTVLLDLHWHPLMRVKKGGKFRPHGWKGYYCLHELVRCGGRFCSTGWAYTGKKMACTLLARWEEGYEEPWLLLTDLAPEQANAVWYGLRAWIEQGFKVIKSGGWDWQHTRIEDPTRVERMWLVMAVATLWAMAVGSEDEAWAQAQEELKRLQKEWTQSEEEVRRRQEQEQKRLERLREALAERKRRLEARAEARQQARAKAKKAKKAEQKPAGKKQGPVKEARRRQAKGPTGEQREQSLFGRGCNVLLALWLRGENRLPRRLMPQPLPPPEHSASTLTEEEFLAQNNQAASIARRK